MLKQSGGLANPKDEDARAAFLRHAGKEDEIARRFTAAYKETQPTRMYADEEGGEGEGEGEAGDGGDGGGK